MKYSLEIGKIIEGSIKYDFEKVKNYTNLLIEKLQKDGDFIAAEKFKRICENSGVNSIGIANLQSSVLPIDQESKIKLADVYYPSQNNYITILNDFNQIEIDLFINTILHADKLSKYGLEGGNTLLLYGPPGCGKTNCAFMVAKKLGLPIVVARLDSLISSYLGTTSKNLRLLFDYVSKTPCVLFLDEFDAVAKARDDKNELGELKRVVNTLLQNIDSISKETIIIAATNHEKLLDSAVWRRFDYKIKLDKPDLESRAKMVKLFLDNTIKINYSECFQLGACFEDKTGSFIRESLEKSLKRCILENKKVTINEFYNDIFKNNIIPNNQKITNKDKIVFLNSKNKNQKYFTYCDIAKIVGVSKPYVSMVLNGVKNEE